MTTLLELEYMNKFLAICLQSLNSHHSTEIITNRQLWSSNPKTSMTMISRTVVNVRIAPISTLLTIEESLAGTSHDFVDERTAVSVLIVTT